MWPFTKFSPRMVCAGEYRVNRDIDKEWYKIYKCTMKINLKFETYANPVVWKLEKFLMKTQIKVAMIEAVQNIVDASNDPILAKPQSNKYKLRNLLETLK